MKKEKQKMQQYDIYSMVKVDFVFIADKLDFDTIDCLMGITATKKGIGDSFNANDFTKDYWCLSTGYEPSQGIIIQLDKIYNAISNKKSAINSICKQYNAICAFYIIVEDCYNYVPPASYESDFLKFAAAINAEIKMGVAQSG